MSLNKTIRIYLNRSMHPAMHNIDHCCHSSLYDIVSKHPPFLANMTSNHNVSNLKIDKKYNNDRIEKVSCKDMYIPLHIFVSDLSTALYKLVV